METQHEILINDQVGQAKPESFIRNVALFFAAPFIGLLYALAMPFVGLGMLVYMGSKAAFKK